MKHAPIDELKQSLITYEAVAKTSNVDSETKAKRGQIYFPCSKRLFLAESDSSPSKMAAYAHC